MHVTLGAIQFFTGLLHAAWHMRMIMHNMVFALVPIHRRERSFILIYKPSVVRCCIGKVPVYAHWCIDNRAGECLLVL